MGAAKQIVRGMGTLPHVGEHPGTRLLLYWIAAGALAGKATASATSGVAAEAVRVRPGR